MVLHLEFRAKFRAFGMDFGKIAREWNMPVPVKLIGVGEWKHKFMDEKGIYLFMSLTPMASDGGK